MRRETRDSATESNPLVKYELMGRTEKNKASLRDETTTTEVYYLKELLLSVADEVFTGISK